MIAGGTSFLVLIRASRYMTDCGHDEDLYVSACNGSIQSRFSVPAPGLAFPNRAYASIDYRPASSYVECLSPKIATMTILDRPCQCRNLLGDEYGSFQRRINRLPKPVLKHINGMITTRLDSGQRSRRFISSTGGMRYIVDCPPGTPVAPK
jgi:hypothetical protein